MFSFHVCVVACDCVCVYVCGCVRQWTDCGRVYGVCVCVVCACVCVLYSVCEDSVT